MGSIIRCKLERWGGKGGDMKVVLTMSKRYAGLIAQIPEDGDILLKPLQLQPELPMFNALTDDDMAGFAEAEQAAGGEDAEHGSGQLPLRAADGKPEVPIQFAQGRDPTKAEDWFDFNVEPANCNFCSKDFGTSQLRRWKDPEMPQGFWCRECGVAEKIIGARPPTMAYLVNEYLCKCFRCQGDHAPGTMRRWRDERVAYLGYWCEPCSVVDGGPTPWEVDGPAFNAEGFQETTEDRVPNEPTEGAPAAEEGEVSTRPMNWPETGVAIDFDPERVMVNIDSRDCSGAAGANYECTKAPMGTLRAYEMPPDPNMVVGWFCEKCGDKMNEARQALHPWAPGERGFRVIAWSVFRSQIMDASKGPDDPESPWAVIPDCEGGSKEHREAVKAALKEGREVNRADLEHYIMRKWAAEEIAKGARRLKMAELLDAQARAHHAEMEPELPTDGTTVGELKHLEPGTENHRKAVRLFLAGGAELDLAHLAPYVEEPWAKEEMGSLYNAAWSTAADAHRERALKAAKERKLDTGSSITAGDLKPDNGNLITAEDLKAVQALEKADVHPPFSPDDWEIQGHKRALLEKGPGSEEHRSAVRILLSHGEVVSFDNLVHYVDEAWAREEMGRERYQAARDLAAAKKLTKRVETEENSYECRVCLVTKSDQLMEQYFIENGEGRYVCHGCLERLSISREEVPKAFTEEERCHHCNRLMPAFVMKEGTWPGTIKEEFFCPDCHQDRSESAPEQHA